jgi:hypothetical protein
MKDLSTYIFESINGYRIYEGTFSDTGGGFSRKEDRLNYNWRKYGYTLVSKLVSGEPVVVGKEKNSEATVTIDDYDSSGIRELHSKMSNGEVTTYRDFDTCASSKDYYFERLNKQYITGKVNKGNEFEKMFVDSFDSLYSEGLIEFVKGRNPEGKFEKNITIKTKDGKPVVELSGGRNSRRKLGLGNGFAESDPQNEINGLRTAITGKEIGNLISDVTVYIEGNDPYTGFDHLNLSLKSGTKVCFLSSGIQKDITPEICKRAVNGEEDESDFDKFKAFGPVGNEICKMFNISEWCLSQVFNANAGISVDETEFLERLNRFYGKSNVVEEKSKVGRGQYVIYSGIKNSKNIKDLLLDFIGCGYIMVHQTAKGLHYIDLREESDTEELIKGIDSAKMKIIIPKPGEKDRIDIFIDLEHVTLQFNIRWKSGGHKPYPSHFMCDYTLKDDLGKVYDMTIPSYI